MNILNYLRPTKVYTAAEVHAEITAKVLLLMEQMKQQVEAVELPAEMRSELELLRSVGLTNSANMEALKGAEQRVNDINASRQLTADRIRLVQLMHKHYGPDVMLMRTEDFMALLDKYNLVCGVLEDYTGSIPRKNLEEIARAKRFIIQDFYEHGTEMMWLNRQIGCYYKITGIRSDVKDRDIYKRFPLIEHSTYYNSKGFSVGNRSRLFIAAPAQEMKNRPKIVERIRTEDPFVFSVTDCGVLIYSAWGDEGNDELVQKYRRLNEWLASCDAMKSLNV